MIETIIQVIFVVVILAACVYKSVYNPDLTRDSECDRVHDEIDTLKRQGKIK